MENIKERVLREFGDEGADTLERYFAQIEYTAFWCIQMLYDAHEIESVIPEGVEDVVIVKRNYVELHQVKTRDESQGPWTNAILLPILCKLYHNRKAYKKPCRFHFVSNQIADNKTKLGKNSYGALYQVKFLLDVLHDGQELSEDEQNVLEKYEETLVPKLCKTLHVSYTDTISKEDARNLLHNTRIETSSALLRNPSNLLNLQNALAELTPGTPSFTVPELQDSYDRLILLIIRKTILGKSLEARKIVRKDILNCRTDTNTKIVGYPDLSQVPGESLLQKKTFLGGFDPTEWPVFHKQRALSQRVTRRLHSLNLGEKLDNLITAILDLQSSCRHKVCREQGIRDRPGPKILEALRPGLTSLANHHFPDSFEVDMQFCLGMLWEETDLCLAWWHALDENSQRIRQ